MLVVLGLSSSIAIVPELVRCCFISENNQKGQVKEQPEGTGQMSAAASFSVNNQKLRLGIEDEFEFEYD